MSEEYEKELGTVEDWLAGRYAQGLSETAYRKRVEILGALLVKARDGAYESDYNAALHEAELRRCEEGHEHDVPAAERAHFWESREGLTRKKLHESEETLAEVKKDRDRLADDFNHAHETKKKLEVELTLERGTAERCGEWDRAAFEALGVCHPEYLAEQVDAIKKKLADSEKMFKWANGEKDKLVAKFLGVQEKCKGYLREIEALRDEWYRAKDKLTIVEKERDMVVEQKGYLRDDNSKLEGERDQARKEADDLREKCADLDDSRGQAEVTLKEVSEELRIERENPRIMVDMTANAMNHERDRALRESDILRSRLVEVEKERDNALTKHKEVKQASAGFQSALLHALESGDKLVDERDEALAKLAATEKELDDSRQPKKDGHCLTCRNNPDALWANYKALRNKLTSTEKKEDEYLHAADDFEGKWFKVRQELAEAREELGKERKSSKLWKALAHSHHPMGVATVQEALSKERTAKEEAEKALEEERKKWAKEECWFCGGSVTMDGDADPICFKCHDKERTAKENLQIELDGLKEKYEKLCKALNE